MTVETKLQIEALKKLEKDKNAIRYAKNEESLYLTLDGTYAFRFCEEPFYLNLGVLKEEPSLTSYFNSDSLSATYELTITNEMRKLSNATGVLLKCEKFTTCVNERLLKMFMDSFCKLYAKSEKSIVYFARNNGIYAVVIPINLGKQEREG